MSWARAAEAKKARDRSTAFMLTVERFPGVGLGKKRRGKRATASNEGTKTGSMSTGMQRISQGNGKEREVEANNFEKEKHGNWNSRGAKCNFC